MLNNSLRCTSLLLKGERHFSQGAELSHLSLIWDFSVYTGQTRNLKITNSTVLFGNKTCEINLTCSVENPNDSVSFTWQPLGRMGPDLTISWDPEISNEQNYSCIAKNPVNNLSSTLKKKKKFFFFKSAKSLCKGNSLHQASLRALTRYLLFLCSASPVSCPVLTAETTGNIEYNLVPPGNTVYAQVSHPNKVSSFSFILLHCHYFYSHHSQAGLHNHLAYPNDIRH
ncbi:SLAM family member 6 [Loxodonta africana]|uniref:SLAM family member 6 n=1 Tax=Loxodonta africana TaxID=9785 RepID=UPI0030D413DC